MQSSPLVLRPITRGALILAGVAMAQAKPPTSQPLDLVREAQPVSTIVLAEKATRVAQFAAFELQWHLRQITGAEVPIVRDGQTATGTRILVGESGATTDLGLSNASFASQEYMVRFLPGALLLMGRDKADYTVVRYNQTPTAAELQTWPGFWDEQGTMYAVYDFLERHCGVRWLDPTEFGTVCPTSPTLTVAGTETRRAPFFRYRWAWYGNSESYDACTSLWPAGSDGFRKWEAAAFPRLHQAFPDPGAYVLAKRGWVQLFRYRRREGGEKCVGNHSLYGYYKRFWEEDPNQPDAFVEKRPAWFAQGYEGRPPQMCYASPGLIQQVAQDARDYFDGKGINPWSLQPVTDRNDVWGENFFCVEPMDNDQFCRCAECQKWLKPDRGFDPFFSNGRHSDYFFNFVNAVARELAKTHPHKRIVTLAYMSHAAPPRRVKLEPNVVVQFCFACHRLTFDRASYEHEVELLEQWASLRRREPLYLWLYYTFPVEIANNGSFHCFPGFFAHAIGEQFTLFRKARIRGIFHCGYGQDVEAYLTYKLMDDPSLEVEPLLDEYFGGLYGAAAAPMKELYLAIERTYSTPANYPESIASGRIEAHHHQTEEVAWGWLGTRRRMDEFAKLLDAARALAQTEAEKQQVARFELGTWDYMVAGRQRYLDQARARYGAAGPAVQVPFAVMPPANADPTCIDRDEAAVLLGWRSQTGERTQRQVEARLLNDGTRLYVQLEERVNPRTLTSAEPPNAGDHWQVLLSAQRQQPGCEILVGINGTATGTPPGTIVVSDARHRDRWTVSLALPLSTWFPGETHPDGSLWANLARRSPGSDDEPVWVPTFGEFRDPARCRELRLDSARSLPPQVPAAAELAALNSDHLVALWRLDEGKGSRLRDASPNALEGKTVNDPAWSKDGARRSLRFEDRRGQYVDLGNPAAVNLTGPLTLEAWVRYETSDTWYPALFGKGYEQTGAYSLHLRPGLTVWFEIDGEDGTRYHYNPTERALTPGSWTHVVATYDGAIMRVYLNGREAGPGREVKTTIRKTSEPLRLGWLGSYGHFNGCLRQVAVYSRPMSAGEVFARYQAGRRP